MSQFQTIICLLVVCLYYFGLSSIVLDCFSMNCFILFSMFMVDFNKFRVLFFEFRLVNTVNASDLLSTKIRRYYDILGFFFVLVISDHRPLNKE